MAIKKDLMGDPTLGIVGVFPAAHFFLDFVRKNCLWGPLQVPGLSRCVHQLHAHHRTGRPCRVIL